MSLFRGIHIPDTFGLDVPNFELLKSIAEINQEEPEALVRSSFGIASIWGETILTHGFAPGISFGLVDTEEQVSLFDIEAEAKRLREEFSKKSKGSQEIGFDIPDFMKPGIRNACGYYAVEVNLIASIAIGIRSDTIQAYREGLTAMYYVEETGLYYDLDLRPLLPI